MESVTQVKILDEIVFISLHANAIGKGMNPSSQLWVNSRTVLFL